MACDDVIVETDPRGRVSLARLGVQGGHRYIGRIEPDGTVVLEPAIVMTEAEARLRANPELLARIEDNMAHPERWVERPRRPQAKSA
jgi:hypothetical protein